MSNVILFLLEHHFPYLIAFFMGLILASSKIMYDHIINHQAKNVLFGAICLAAGLSLAFFVPANNEKAQVQLSYVFL